MKRHRHKIAGYKYAMYAMYVLFACVVARIVYTKLHPVVVTHRFGPTGRRGADAPRLGNLLGDAGPVLLDVVDLVRKVLVPFHNVTVSSAQCCVPREVGTIRILENHRARDCPFGADAVRREGDRKHRCVLFAFLCYLSPSTLFATVPRVVIRVT